MGKGLTTKIILKDEKGHIIIPVYIRPENRKSLSRIPYWYCSECDKFLKPEFKEVEIIVVQKVSSVQN